MDEIEPETPPRVRPLPEAVLEDETPPIRRQRTLEEIDIVLPRKVSEHMLNTDFVDKAFKVKNSAGEFRSCHCKKQCYEKVPALPLILQWRLLLQAEKTRTKRQFLVSIIASNCSDVSRPKETFKPHIGTIPVCRHFWCRVHFTRNDLKPYFKALTENNGVYLDSSSDGEDSDEATNIVEGRGCIKSSFLRSFKKIVADFGEQMVHLSDSVALEEEGEERMKTLVYLPCGLFQDMRDCCKTMIKDKLVPSSAKVKWLEKLRRQHFPHVEIKKWIPFAKCSICWEYYESLIACKSDQQRDILRKCQELHREHVSLMRDRHSIRMTLGEERPDLFLCVIIDGMDNNKTQLPICSQLSKEIESTGDTMGTKIVGVIAHGHGFQGTWTYPRYTGGSSETITILHRAIKKVADKNRGVLPPCLLIQADNCGKENKNQYVVTYCGWLLATKVFKVVQLNFLLVGHTHSIIDQRFSRIHQKIKGKNVYSFPKFQELVQPLFQKPQSVDVLTGDVTRARWTEIEEIGFTADFKKFCENSNKFEIHGLGTSRDPTTNEKVCLHSLRFENNQDGIPALVYQVFDDSGPWYGHHAEVADGAEPIAIFKGTPSFPAVIESSPRKRLLEWEKVKARFQAVFDVKGAQEKDDTRAAKAWWEGFKKEEEEFWKNVPPTVKQVQVRSQTEPPISKTNTDTAAQEQIVRDILSFFDNPVPLENLPSCEAKNILMKIPKARTLAEKEAKVISLNAGRHPGAMVSGRGVFVWQDNDAPPDTQMFNPIVDVVKGQFLVLYFEKPETTFMRGWEIAVADSDPYDVRSIETSTVMKCIDVTYYQPATQVTSSGWGGNWVNRKYRAMQKQGRTIYSEKGVDVDMVAYSTFLTDKGKVLSVTDRAKVLRTIQRIEEHHRRKEAAGTTNAPLPFSFRSNEVAQRVDDDSEEEEVDE